MKKRLRIHISGRVQGVGFRPTVFRYATANALSGFVRNTPEGVIIEIQGEADSTEGFIEKLKRNPPRQARMENITISEIPPETTDDTTSAFAILSSARSGEISAGMPPDIATCSNCQAEMLDPADRRYRYPFINCTNCGPRFSIIRELPYDRKRTSMSAFKLCPQCRKEYETPSDRRFEAQPNACGKCGPRLRLLMPDGSFARGDPLDTAARLLKKGAVLAVKGIGGYHLSCDAASDRAVALLRKRKHRPHKSLAVMFKKLDELREHAEVSDAEAAELSSCAAPIVIVRRHKDRLPTGQFRPLSKLISPDTQDIGAFLPYSPIHHLLLAKTGPLVMTSGNRAEEPIAKDEEELKNLLGPIADAALIHDREILRRCDDSVIKVSGGKRIILRRSRGIVPDPVLLPLEGPPVLACGAEMKNTLCITRENKAFISPHVGELSDFRAYRFFLETIGDLSELLHVRPRITAHDAHPDYPSTRYALGLDSTIKTAVQHHHAHIASCMAEHGLLEPVIGVALDGTGFGPDGTIWGGEFLVADFNGWRRLAHFRQYPMPGGEQAVLNPVRMALSCLLNDLPPHSDALIRKLLPSLSEWESSNLSGMIKSGLRCPLTSSAGRLFDAAAALLGIAEPITYEGQAAVRLQTLARPDLTSSYPFEIEEHRSPANVSFRQTIRSMVSDIHSGVDRGAIAGKFHNTMAEAVAETCDIIRAKENLNRVALSGGVFQNDLLLERAERLLVQHGFSVYTHDLVPPNDAGISLGQAAIAIAQHGRTKRPGRV